MPNLNELSLNASTNITPSTFVLMDVSNGYSVVQATGTANAFIGISQKGTNVAGGLLSSYGGTEVNYAATPGEGIEVFVVGDVCPLVIGSGGCTPRSLLTSDANGNGVVATSGQYVGAQALDFGNSGDLVNVLVQNFKI